MDMYCFVRTASHAAVLN